MSKEIQIKLNNGLCFAAKTWGDNSKPPLLALHDWLDNTTLRLRKYLKLSQRGRRIRSYETIGGGLSALVGSVFIEYANSELLFIVMAILVFISLWFYQQSLKTETKPNL